MRRDPVKPDVALAVLRRDAGCVAVTLGEDPATCHGRLTLDHIKDQPRMGKRAPSDEAHLVSLCEQHHLWSGWATSGVSLGRTSRPQVSAASAAISRPATQPTESRPRPGASPPA